MATKTKSLLSGRTSLAALLILLLAVIASSILLVRRAEAQGGTADAKPVQFAPLVLSNRSTNYEGNGVFEVNVLLPSIKNLIYAYVTRFRLVLSTPDGDLSYQFESSIGAQSFEQVEVSIVSVSTGIYELNLLDRMTGAQKNLPLPSGYEEVAVRIEPAKDQLGNEYEPVSADLEIRGANEVIGGGPLGFYCIIQQPYSK